MKKRILATLLALTLMLCAVGGAWAEYDSVTFEADLLSGMDALQTAGEAIKESNRAVVAAGFYLEYALYQLDNGMEMEARALWNDAVIGRVGTSIAVSFDLSGEGVLLMVYNILSGEVTAASAAIGADDDDMLDAMLDAGATKAYVVDGDDWTDVVVEVVTRLTQSN